MTFPDDGDPFHAWPDHHSSATGGDDDGGDFLDSSDPSQEINDRRASLENAEGLRLARAL